MSLRKGTSTSKCCATKTSWCCFIINTNTQAHLPVNLCMRLRREGRAALDVGRHNLSTIVAVAPLIQGRAPGDKTSARRRRATLIRVSKASRPGVALAGSSNSPSRLGLAPENERKRNRYRGLIRIFLLLWRFSDHQPDCASKVVACERASEKTWDQNLICQSSLGILSPSTRQVRGFLAFGARRRAAARALSRLPGSNHSCLKLMNNRPRWRR